MKLVIMFELTECFIWHLLITSHVARTPTSSPNRVLSAIMQETMILHEAQPKPGNALEPKEAQHLTDKVSFFGYKYYRL